MASKGFDGGPSTGQGFEQQSSGISQSEVPDPFAGQSMSGNNTVTERPAFGAAGSDSEGSELQSRPDVHSFGDLGHVSTALAPDVPVTDVDIDADRVPGNHDQGSVDE